MSINRPRPGSTRDYKRGAVMGLTVAEAFILLSFILLLLFTWWQVDSDKRSLRLADSLGELTAEKKALIVAGLGDGTFDLALQLRKAGVSEKDAAAISDTAKYSRFMREEDLKRLMNGAVELEPGTLIKLSEAVEIKPETRLNAALDTALNPYEGAVHANARLAQAAADEEALVTMINQTLGQKIREAGGKISADGTITLPQDILFDQGSDVIRNPRFLKDLCAPWVRTLQASGLDISELKIEGHASSEGRPGRTSEQVYLDNLDLSQRRAQNALQICLNSLEASSVMDWARGRLSSTGYSSSHLIYTPDGQEDREASRRVMFSMEMNREKLLADIRGDLGVSALEVETSNQDQTSGRPRIIDGDTLAIGERRWRLFGIDAPEHTQRCKGGDGVELKCGELATAELVRLVGDAVVRCEEIDKDRYNRSVGKCFVGNADIGRTMVQRGMARAYSKYSHDYDAEEQIARSLRVGFWAGEFENPADYRRAH